jgi:hypothetical protein
MARLGHGPAASSVALVSAGLCSTAWPTSSGQAAAARQPIAPTTAALDHPRDRHGACGPSTKYLVTIPQRHSRRQASLSCGCVNAPQSLSIARHGFTCTSSVPVISGRICLSRTGLIL